MLKKNPDERINIAQIKDHPWMTIRGTYPMITTEENCMMLQVTEDDIDKAMKPAISFFSKVSSCHETSLTN